MNKLLVVAGNAKQYEKFLQDSRIPRSETVYIRTNDDLQGFHGIPLVTTGEYWLSDVAPDVLAKYQKENPHAEV